MVVDKGKNMSEWKQLWLVYHRTDNQDYCCYARRDVVIDGFSVSETDGLRNSIISNSVQELYRGLDGMLGISHEQNNAVVKNSVDRIDEPYICFRKVEHITEDDRESLSSLQLEESFRINVNEHEIAIEAEDEKGLLHGVFSLLQDIGTEKKPNEISGTFIPSNPLRILNHYDNMTNDIERGYAGKSFFFQDGKILVNERTKDYARLAASVGINGVVINNVNVTGNATWLITDRYFDELKEMAEIFGGYGIRLFLSLNFASPIEIGGLKTCDPLDETVIAWWKNKMAEVFLAIPNFGGFLVKADSEGRPGPLTYGRTQKDGANMLADLVKPYGGIIIWRCFVYNCKQDWRDHKTDRARAAYDVFKPEDGQYRDNVILQIKNGPMDFQIREPVHPLLGGLTKTNQMLEVQVTQEYTGQQIDVCYLIPMFKEILGFRTYCTSHGEGKRTKIDSNDRVKDIISGRTFGNRASGMTGIAAVANTGNDKNWTGSDLAAVNFYGFGRLAWNTELTAQEIAEEWARLTYDTDDKTIQTLVKILMGSRKTYEKYTTPLGVGWMVTPSCHYGCSVDGYEYTKWGGYHRADHMGLGVDRSSSGSGYAQLYYSENAKMYDDMKTCPEELLLFFHHVPYTYRLSDGRTLIQYLYDMHFEGYEEVQQMAEEFHALKGHIPDDSYENISERFDRQLINAYEWRDQFNSSFHIKSGIDDEKGRKIY